MGVGGVGAAVVVMEDAMVLEIFCLFLYVFFFFGVGGLHVWRKTRVNPRRPKRKEARRLRAGAARG